MPGRRAMTSILTGFALLLQPLLLPLASSAQSNDPIGAGGFIGPPQPTGPSSNQTTQTSRNFLVRVCVPPDLVKNESWGHPYPGSEMADFRSLLRDYILAHGDPRVQYRIKDQAFEIFNRARRASAPYTPDPRNLLEEVSAEQACPPTNYTNTLEVGPDDNSPSPPAQPAAVQDSVPPYPLTPKDAVPLQARRSYEEAAKQGGTDAMYRLGLMYKDGDGVQKNPGAAAQWFYEAGRRGHPYAQEELGWMFFSGSGVKQDDRAALGWFLPAAQAGLARSQTVVASIYDEGKVVAKNPTEAVAWYRKAAAQKQPLAMYQLGLHLRGGNGVAWSEAEAMQWLKKAGDQGSAEAEYFVAMGYEYGLGQAVGQGIQDYRQAVSWLTRSADHGNDYALTELAMLYENGWGVNQDLRQAKRLYQKASNSSIPEVAKWARSCVADLTEKDVDTSPTRPPHQAEKSPGIGPLIAIGVGILLLASLFSGPSEHGTGGGPPIVGGNSTGPPTDGPTSTPAPRTPTCHQVPMGFDTPNGLPGSNPTAGGVPTRLECN